MVKRLEPHQRKGKDKELREKADLLSSARNIPEDRLFHATDDPKVRRRLANELAEWADLDESTLLDTFPLKKRINPRWFYNMAKDDNYFSECLAYARAKIGEREELKLSGRHDYLMKKLPLYSTQWIEAEEKKNEAAKLNTREVVERYVTIPDCGTGDKK